MSTHQYAVGDRVIINPEIARPTELNVIWTVTRHLKVNVVIERVDGTGRPMRINPLDLRHAPAATAPDSAAQAEVIPYHAPFDPGTLVTIAGPRWHQPPGFSTRCCATRATGGSPACSSAATTAATGGSAAP